MKFEKLSIVIPVYNEEKTIIDILDKVISVNLPIKKEIICIDDGSKDRSGDLINNFIKNNKDLDISYFKKDNGGKGSAVRLGFEKAQGDIITVQDADLEYDPNDFIKLLEPILKGETKVTYGSRYLSQKGHLKEHNHLTYKIHRLGNSGLSLITTILYWQKITDMETCYKMFTREVYNNLKLVSNNFNIEPEITAKILKKGYKVTEVPINYYSRDFMEGKKITWKDGVRAAFCLMKWRIIN